MHSSVTHQFSWQAIGKQDSEVAKLKWQASTSQNSTKQTGEVSSERCSREQQSFKIRNSLVVWGKKKRGGGGGSIALIFSILDLISSSITLGAWFCTAGVKQLPSFSKNQQAHGCCGQSRQEMHCTGWSYVSERPFSGWLCSGETSSCTNTDKPQVKAPLLLQLYQFFIATG